MKASRGHQGFENFCSVLARLEDAAERLPGLSELEKAGVVQLFEAAWELGWKSLRDCLADNGAPPDVPTAANVIRAAFAVNLIENGDAWIEAVKARNIMSHEYDPAAFERTVGAIAERYLPMLRALETSLRGEADAGN